MPKLEHKLGSMASLRNRLDLGKTTLCYIEELKVYNIHIALDLGQRFYYENPN
jgi:hypothetical protein